ncbi:MAG: hypothetical protein JWP15_2266 [Alphaproteobacteria bacterium]|nr:hypothetical protein [Alphaproteobacteria bacterium]
MVVLESGDAIGVTIRNVSNDGFMAEHESFVRIGSQVSLGWPGEGLRHAQVRWALSGRFGAAFEDGKAAGRQVLGTA